MKNLKNKRKLTESLDSLSCETEPQDRTDGELYEDDDDDDDMLLVELMDDDNDADLAE